LSGGAVYALYLEINWFEPHLGAKAYLNLIIRLLKLQEPCHNKTFVRASLIKPENCCKKENPIEAGYSGKTGPRFNRLEEEIKFGN
jgi:hypothetical protein